jgi:uncharacterized membrane protein YbhN (UPF0104 family)
MARSRRISRGLAIRLIVSVTLLVILITKVPDFDGVFPASHHGRTALFLGAAFAMALAGVVLAAWRWQRVLSVYDVDVGIFPLFSVYLASLFVGNVLPSTIGGDVLRVSRLGRRVGSTEAAFGSVVLERLSGFVALPALVLVGFAVRPALLDEDRAFIALLIAGHPRAAGRFADNENWTRFIGAVHQGVDCLRRDPAHVAHVLLTAIVYQLSVVASVMLIATALDLPVPLTAIFAFVPAVAMVQVLPISVSGLGVREGMLVLFLEPLGASEAQCIGLGLLWYASLLLVSALGAPSFVAVQRAQTHTSP